MKITYRKSTKQVVMVDSDINNEFLSTIEVTDDLRAKQGYTMYFNGKDVSFTPHPSMIEKEKEELDRQDFYNNIQMLQGAKNTDDIKPILEKLLTKTYAQNS